jgi:F-type H+-transporting ATPase subunit alpha
LDLAQYRARAAYAKLSADELDKASRDQLARGARITEVLKQKQFAVMSVEKQVCILYAATQGHLDDVAVEDIKRWEEGFHDFVVANHADIHAGLKDKKALTDELEGKLKAAIGAFKEQFKAGQG